MNRRRDGYLAFVTCVIIDEPINAPRTRNQSKHRIIQHPITIDGFHDPYFTRKRSFGS